MTNGNFCRCLVAFGIVLTFTFKPLIAQPKDDSNVVEKVDQLTNGLTAEQMEEIDRIVSEKIKAMQSKPHESTLKNLKLKLGDRFYFYNFEGSRYKVRNARTFFGNIVEAKIAYTPDPDVRITGGVVCNIPFSEPDIRWGNFSRDFKPGDHSEKKVDLNQPYIQLLYKYKNASFIFGDIDTPHHYHNIVQYDVYEILRPTEKGMQVLFDNGVLSEDVFINWMERNTPGNHERFDLGTLSTLKWKNGSAALQTLYVHRGGVEFEQDPVIFENHSFALILDQSWVFKNYSINRFGIEVVPLYTVDLPVDANGQRISGFGTLSSFYLNFGNWNFKSGYWSGSDDVYAEEGIPFSREERYIYAELNLDKKLKQDIGLQFKLTGGKFGKKFDGVFVDQKLMVYWKQDFWQKPIKD